MTISIQELRDIDKYFAQKQYNRAIILLKRLVDDNPSEVSLNLKLADAYFLHGRNAESISILKGIAENYARLGFITKAVAVQKKIQRIDPNAFVDIYQFIEDAEPESPAEAEEPVAEQGEDARFRALDSLFKGLSKDEFSEIYSHLDERALPADEMVFEEGETDNSLFIIVYGAVKVIANHRGRKVELAKLGPGQFFGEVALLTGKARTASVQSDEDSIFLVLERERFLSLSKRFPALTENLTAALEWRAQDAIEKIMKADEADTVR